MKKILVIAFFLLLQNLGFSQKVIKQDIQYLSSDELQGRFPGTEGENKAANYIWKELSAVGCTSFYKNGIQEFSKEMNSKNEKFLLKGKNVVGYLKGKNSDTYIVIGAHYDHLGMGGVGSGSRMPDTVAVHNGADDNASGVSAMLECARILSKKELNCGIVFVAFSAEEKGLIGSKYFVDNLPVAKEKIKMMINFDMVGRLDSVLTIQGTGTGLEFDSLMKQELVNLPFKIKQVPDGFGPSDQTSFYAEKMPVLYFHTATHEQYHTPFDDFELINTTGVGQIAELASKLVLKIANTKTLTYQAIGSQTDMSHSIKTGLGIMPDHASTGGLTINAIRTGRAAEKAGIQKGDIIISIQGEKVENIETYMKIMNKFEKGDILVIDVLRNNEKLIFTVNL